MPTAAEVAALAEQAAVEAVNVLTRLCADCTEITELRATDPAAIGARGRTAPPADRARQRQVDDRRRRPPGPRCARAVGSRPTAMNSRTDLLDRLRAALADPAWTACSAPPTSSTTCCCSARSRTRWCSRSMNRGGLAGAQFELDDRMTGCHRRGDRRSWA